MISASGAEAHRFGRVRRNGYDPAEVDAVVARLVETLRSYESKTESLERRLDEADASADAIRRTFLAAEATAEQIESEAEESARTARADAQREADELLAEARSTAAGLIATAEAESAAMAELAERLDHEIAKRRSEVMSAAQEEADAVMADAEWAAAQQKVTAADEASRIMDEAEQTAELRERTAIMRSGYVTLSAARLGTAAREEADRVVAEAQLEAARIVEEADEDATELHRQAAALRTAIADLQRSAGALAMATADEAATLDLTAIEGIDEELLESFEPAEASNADADDPTPVLDVTEAFEPHDTIDTGEPSRAASEDAEAIEQVELAQGVGVDVLDAPEATDDSNMIDVAATVDVTDDDAPAIEMEPTDAREVEDQESDEGRTYYQRSTGVPLSERIKIARKSS